MTDYFPIDITPLANAGPEWFQRGQKFEDESWMPPESAPMLGQQMIRGIPFCIGSLNSVGNVILFGCNGYAQSVKLELNAQATWLIFAHRLLESSLFTGGPLGETICHYTFQLTNGIVIRHPIRERFEISLTPPRWGQLPLLAVADKSDTFAEKDSGPWERTGWRQTEVWGAWPRWFVLWPWKNPHPEIAVQTVTIEPAGPAFLIAGITASTLAETPFEPAPAQNLKVESTSSLQSAPPEVAVDRGTISLQYPLPDSADPAALPGWGAAVLQSQAGPSSVRVSAQPSATITLKQSDGVIDTYPWQKVLESGKLEAANSRIEIIDREMNWVHTRVIDAETGAPLPCRIHFRSAAGIPYAPHGHPDHLLSDKSTWHIDIGGDVRLGRDVYAYIDGKCQGWLPSGEVTVEAARGFEYEPVRQTLSIQPGQRELTIALKRWANWNAKGWYSGDTHVHFLSTSGALLEAQGEDLNVVNLLQTQWAHLFTNTEDFIGRPVNTPDGRTTVYTSQENRQHILGHLSLLGLKEPVMPWCSDGPSEAEFGGGLETTLSHWADACHAQGGKVILPHFPEPNAEAAALIATGRADAVEMILAEEYTHLEYYRYLNGGYRLPLVGGTDKMSAEVPVGLYRTYVFIPPDQPFNYQTWSDNLALGRTFISSGPIIHFSVNGAQVGDTIQFPKGGGTLEVQARVESIFPVHNLQIIQNGRVVASSEDKGGKRALSLTASLRIQKDSWLAARAGGPGYYNLLRHHDELGRGIFAHTSPIYITVGEKWQMDDPQTTQYMLTLIHGSLEYIRMRSSQQSIIPHAHPHTEADHLTYLERPFKEALRAIEARRKHDTRGSETPRRKAEQA